MKKYWPGADPIGKRVRLIDCDKPWLEVVGVTKTGKYMWIAETPKPFIYLPFAQQDRMQIGGNAGTADLAVIQPF